MNTILWAYGALLMGIFLEGEIALLSGAIALYKGYISLLPLVIVALLGVQATDWFHFYLGRFTSQKLLRNKPILKRRINKINRLVEKYPNIVLITYRFLYGFRTVLPIAIGLSSIRTIKFAIFSLISASLWIGGYLSLGYFFGEKLQAYFQKYSGFELYTLGGLAVLGLLIFSTRYIYRKIRWARILVERQAHKAQLNEEEKIVISKI